MLENEKNGLLNQTYSERKRQIDKQRERERSERAKQVDSIWLCSCIQLLYSLDSPLILK